MKYKLKYIFLPYMLLSIIFIVSYLLIYWLLVIKLELIVFNMFIEFWLPMVLFMLMLIFVSPFSSFLKEVDFYVRKLFAFLAVFTNIIFILACIGYMRTDFTDISHMKYPFAFYVTGNISIFLMLFFVNIDETYLRLMDNNKFNYQAFMKQRMKNKEKIKKEKEKRAKRRAEIKKNREERRNRERNVKSITKIG